jgi:folate-binding protein YgfZ
MDAQFCTLRDDALLHLHGDQVLTFLQGQLTCDCEGVDDSHSSEGALCSAQGRVLTDCRLLWLETGHYALRLGRDLREPIQSTLQKYAMFSRTRLDANDDDTLLALWGEGARRQVEALFGAAPAQRDACVAHEGALACQVDTDGREFELIAPAARAADMLTAIKAGAAEATEAQWRARELRRGLLRCDLTLSGEQVPQALNYDLAGLLNFRKGCYIGQEVVARLHYKGKSKRRYALFSGEGSLPPTGATLETKDSGEKAGTVLRALPVSDSQGLVAALVNVDLQDSPLLAARGDANDGPQTVLQPVALPYSLRGSADAS